MDRILRAKPYIIAEVGSNWHTLEDCFDSIIAAKKAGANAVKFQLFSNIELYGPGYLNYGSGGHEPHALLHEWLQPLSTLCQEHCVDFLCSAFSIEGYRAVDPYVRYHKIASSEFDHVPLVRFVKSLGKPIIASLGGQDEGAIIAMSREYPDETTVMNCKGSYPSFDMNFESEFGPLNLSDHSLGIFLPVSLARGKGLRVLEKHFRLDHITNTPDAPHSIPPDEFAEMVRLIRNPPADNEEAEFKRTALRRAKALRNIPAGESLLYVENFAYFREQEGRPGLRPVDHDKWVGRVANRTIVMGDCIEEKDLEC